MGSTEREAAIENAITEPLKASGDEGSAEKHPLPDQILADQYLDRKAAARQKHGGMRIFKIESPGGLT